jgi:hypothetical protein
VALLPFAQLELPGGLPLPDGRYLVREGGPAAQDPAPGETAESGGEVDVLAVRTLGAARASGRRRRARRVEPEPEPAPLPLARVTLIKARPFGDAAAARRWLDSVAGDEQLAAGLVAETAGTLNRALLAYRVAAPDPYCAPVDSGDAVTTRFGYGSGEEVAEGRWQEAREPARRRGPGPRRQAIDSVGASARVAAVLAGRDSVAPAESLLSGAALAVLEDRGVEAALLLAAAAEAAGRAGPAPAGAVEEAQRLRKEALAGGQPTRERLRDCLRALRGQAGASGDPRA